MKGKVTMKTITVYKVLIRRIGYCETPFMLKEVNFQNNQCILRSKLEKTDNYTIDIGLHACTTINEAKSIVCDLRRISVVHAYIYKAEIPRGSRYFLGCNEDIVSDKLIIKNETIEI